MASVVQTRTQRSVAMDLHNLLISAQDTLDFPIGGQNQYMSGSFLNACICTAFNTDQI